MEADLCLCKEVSFIQLATWDDVYMIDVLVSHLEPSDWAALVLQKVADSIASVILNMVCTLLLSYRLIAISS